MVAAQQLGMPLTQAQLEWAMECLLQVPQVLLQLLQPVATTHGRRLPSTQGLRPMAWMYILTRTTQA